MTHADEMSSGQSDASAIDPRPLAAFQLGYRLYDIRKWFKLGWENAGNSDCWQGVVLCRDEIQHAQILLADQIPSHVAGELKRLIDEIHTFSVDALDSAQTEKSFRGIPFGNSSDLGDDSFSKLVEIARTLQFPERDGRQMTPWFCLGVALGEFSQALAQIFQGSALAANIEDACQVLRIQLRKLPSEFTEWAPWLRDLYRDDLKPTDALLTAAERFNPDIGATDQPVAWRLHLAEIALHSTFERLLKIRPYLTAVETNSHSVAGPTTESDNRIIVSLENETVTVDGVQVQCEREEVRFVHELLTRGDWVSSNDIKGIPDFDGVRFDRLRARIKMKCHLDLIESRRGLGYRIRKLD